MKVALTQSEGRLEGLREALLACGVEVLQVPLIRTESLLNARESAQRLLDCDWLLFTSPAGVASWQALELSFTPKIGTVGEKTAEAVRKAGGEVSLVGKPQTAAGLAARFLARIDNVGQVGLPQGDRALPTLQVALEACGIETHPLVIYRTVTLDWQAGEVDVVVLASPSAVAALPSCIAQGARLVALGPSTAGAAARRGWKSFQANAPTAEAVLRTIERLKHDRETKP